MSPRIDSALIRDRTRADTSATPAVSSRRLPVYVKTRRKCGKTSACGYCFAPGNGSLTSQHVSPPPWDFA